MGFTYGLRLFGILTSFAVCLSAAIANGDDPGPKGVDSRARTAELRLHYERIAKELERATALRDETEVAALSEIKRNIKNTIEHLGGSLPVTAHQRYDVAAADGVVTQRPQLYAAPPKRIILAVHDDDEGYENMDEEMKDRFKRRRNWSRTDRDHHGPSTQDLSRPQRRSQHTHRHPHRDHPHHHEEEHGRHEHHEHDHAERGRQFHVRMAAHHLEQAGMEEIAQRIRRHARELAEQEKREQKQRTHQFEALRERLGTALREGRERLEEHGELLRELAEEVEELDDELDELEYRLDEMEERMERRRRGAQRREAADRYDSPPTAEGHRHQRNAEKAGLEVRIATLEAARQKGRSKSTIEHIEKELRAARKQLERLQAEQDSPH